jgi:hypothetical protein
MLMHLLWWMLSFGAAQAKCNTPAVLQSELNAAAPALGSVSLEIPLLGMAPEPTEILAVLDAHGLKATLLTTHRWASRHSTFLKRATADGHEVGVWISLSDDIGLNGTFSREPDYSDWVDAIRLARRKTRTASGQRPKTMAISALPPIAEMAGEAVGFRAIAPNERTIDDRPRRSTTASKSIGRAMVIGQGKYSDGCGHILPSWSLLALDRATHVAARGEWVRIGLPSTVGVAPILAQWISEVVKPQGWPVLTLVEMAAAARAATGASPKATPMVAVPKRIHHDTWVKAAKTLTQANPMPQRPEHSINLTETFFGLVTLLAAPEQPVALTLGHLQPPTSSTVTELKGPTAFSAAELQAMVSTLHSRLRGHIPSLVSIGDQSLTAAEALQLMARAFTNQPLTASPVDNPSPYASDLGWGESTGLTPP